jgi:hypothetical protein
VDGNLRLGVLEDRSAIQIARAQVLDALYSSRRDTSASAVARLLLEILPGMQRIEIGLPAVELTSTTPSTTPELKENVLLYPHVSIEGSMRKHLKTNILMNPDGLTNPSLKKPRF